MLETNLKHIEADADFKSLVAENENVMLCCGRMGPMCLPVYYIMEDLQSRYPDVQFRDMDFDGPASHSIRSLAEVRTFMTLPFTIYYKNGKVVEATSSIQNEEQITGILDQHYAKAL